MSSRGGIPLLLAAGIVLAQPTDPNAATSDATARIPPEGATSDLALEKVDSDDPIPVEARLTYTLIVTNNGPDGANGVTVIDALPDSLDFVSASPSEGTCERVGTKVTCEL